MQKRICLLLAAIFACSIIGCGYNFSPGGENIDSKIRAIYVEAFSNPTGEAYVETYLRNALLEQLRRSERFTISKSEEESDAAISGRIIAIQTSHVSYDQSNIAKENGIVMTLEVKFQTRGKEVIWENNNLSGREVYNVTGDTYGTDKNKGRALKKLAVDLAEKAYRNIMSGF